MKLKKDLKKHLYRFSDEDILIAFKMMSNKYRMNILLTLLEHPDLSLDQINGLIGGEFKNISFHSRKLYQAKLISKRNKGMYTQHRLTEYGKKAVKSFLDFQKDPYK